MTEHTFAPPPDGDHGASTGASHVLGAVADVVAALADEDLTELDPAAAGDDAVVLLSAAESLRGAAVARLARFDAGGGCRADAAPSTTAWLRARSGLGDGDVHALVAAARLVATSAEVAEALGRGALGLAAVRALATAASGNRRELFDEHAPLLVELACRLDLDQLVVALRRWRAAADDALADGDAAELHARRGLWASPVGDGAVRIDGLLDPVGGIAVLAALADLSDPDPADVADGPRTAPQRRADALAELARRHLAERSATAGADAAPVAGIDVRIDLADLLRWPTTAGDEAGGVSDGCGADGVEQLVDGCCEVTGLGPLPRSVVQRLCCDAWASRVVVGPDPADLDDLLGPDGPLAALRDTPLGRTLLAAPSAPLDVGRRRRTFTAAQRRALVERDGGCAFPGCDRPPRWCDGHHLRPWEAGGPTDVANGVLLCAHHHTVVHLHRWRPERTPEGRWTFLPPAGSRRPATGDGPRWPRAGPAAA